MPRSGSGRKRYGPPHFTIWDSCYLWECADAELVFTDSMWPDFPGDALAQAISEYSSRNRRFGRVAEAS